MEEKQTLRLAGETITDTAKHVTIPVKPFGIIQKLLMKIGLLNKHRVFEISPILVQNRWKVSARAVGFPDDLFLEGTVKLNRAWGAIYKYHEDFIYITALCIQNDKKEPSKALTDFIRWLPDQQFYDLLDMSLSMAGVPAFMKSIILIKGNSVLNVTEKAATSAQDPE